METGSVTHSGTFKNGAGSFSPEVMQSAIAAVVSDLRAIGAEIGKNYDHSGGSEGSSNGDTSAGTDASAGGGDQQTQGNGPQDPYLSSGQLIDLFRDNFNKEWWDPLEAKIRGGSFSPADIVEYVQSFNYSDVFPKENVPWSLHQVEGGMFQVIDPSGATVFRDDLFKGQTGTFPGYLGKIWSGDLSGRGSFMVTTPSGYDIRFTIALEGRRTN